MMSMRTDNKFVEHKRDVDGIDRRLKRLEDLQGQSTSIQDKIKRSAQLNAQEIIDTVIQISQENTLSMVTNDEFLDLKAETGELIK